MGQKIQTNVDDISADRAFGAHLNFAAPAAKSLTAILAATALTSEAQSITEGISQPDVPRNFRIKGNAAGIAGNVTAHGLNMKGEEISETLAANGDTEVVGVKAFKEFTQIDLPAETHAGTDTISVGTDNKLGLPYLLERDTIQMAFRNGVRESTHPTVAVDADNIENNTAQMNSALNGTDIDIYLMV